MSVDERTLQIEITIVPPKRRKGGQRSSDAEAKSGDAPQIPRIARLMALAIKFQDMVDRGEVRDYADLARLGYVSRARLTQVMNLVLLAPDIQERLLLSENSGSVRMPSETQIRSVTASAVWDDQRRDLAREIPSMAD